MARLPLLPLLALAALLASPLAQARPEPRVARQDLHPPTVLRTLLAHAAPAAAGAGGRALLALSTSDSSFDLAPFLADLNATLSSIASDVADTLLFYGLPASAVKAIDSALTEFVAAVAPPLTEALEAAQQEAQAVVDYVQTWSAGIEGEPSEDGELRGGCRAASALEGLAALLLCAGSGAACCHVCSRQACHKTGSCL